MLILDMNLYCDPALELSRRDSSNEGSQYSFHVEMRKLFKALSSNVHLIWVWGIIVFFWLMIRFVQFSGKHKNNPNHKELVFNVLD